MRTSSVEIAIMEVLTGEKDHLTAQEVYERIRERLPAVNPSTVYRALERMTNAGKISISDMGLGAAVFEVVGSAKHHHLVCQECRRVITIPHEDVAQFFSFIEGLTHFQIATNHLVLFGKCMECWQKDAAAPLPPLPEDLPVK